MTTNEVLDKTYKVWYFGDTPILPPKDNKLPTMDYIQAINVAIRWMKDHREIEIRDERLPVIHVGSKGVEFITSDPNHPHFQEHLKIKIELDKVWGELMNKYL